MSNEYENNYERLMAIARCFDGSMKQIINGFDKDGFVYHSALVVVRAPEKPPNDDDIMVNAEYYGTMSDGQAGAIFKSLGEQMLKQEEEAKDHG